MIWHIEAAPTVWHAKPLAFYWDEIAGTVTGDGASYVLDAASIGSCNLHPMPMSHDFSAEPLKSRTDMAAIIGYRHILPDWLFPYYPKVEDEEIPAELVDLTVY